MRGTELIIGEKYAHTRGRLGDRWAEEVEVTGRAVGGQVSVKDKHGRPAMVKVRHIVGTWADHKAEQESIAALRRQQDEALDKAVIARNEAARYLQQVVPEEVLPRWVKPTARVFDDRSGIAGGGTRTGFTTTELAEIVGAAIRKAVEEDRARGGLDPETPKGK